MILNIGRLNITCNHPHWPNTCKHGPQTWPWWRLISFGKPFDMIAANQQTPGFGGALHWYYCMWIYTRWWAQPVYATFKRKVKQ